MPITFETRIGPGFLIPPTFEAMYFPAGEAHVKVVNENDSNGPLTEIATVTGADSNDLVVLGMWANAAHQRGAKTVALIPYLHGARQDRGIPFGANVYATIINGFSIGQIIAFDPHSPVMVGLINNLTVVDSADLVMRRIIGRPDTDERAHKYTGIIAPDRGAMGRAQHVADRCGLPLYRAEKHRDEATGHLSGFSCEELPASGKFLIVDDICDGGGTFIGLAQATGIPPEQIGLYVSHGVFSGRAGQLPNFFGEIFTTDSYPGQTDVGAHIISLHNYLIGAIT